MLRIRTKGSRSSPSRLERFEYQLDALVGLVPGVPPLGRLLVVAAFQRGLRVVLLGFSVALGGA